MGYRRLFYARDKNMNIVHIEKVQERDEKFFCPFCKEEVSPRMGEKKVWHFAHVGKTCAKLSGEEEGENADLLDITMDLPVLEEVEVPSNCASYLCPLCNQSGAKSYGVKWKGSVYLCKDCFSSLDGNMVEKLS